MGMANLQRMAMQMQQDMARVQQELAEATVEGTAGGGVVKAVANGKQELVSVTIDPDNDTPEQLQRFSKPFQIRPGWQFFTGRFDDLLRVQRHFDVYRGSKVAHPPVVLLRKNARSAWMRVEGVASAADLMLALHTLPAGA